jgi:hypothetical protein
MMFVLKLAGIGQMRVPSRKRVNASLLYAS